MPRPKKPTAKKPALSSGNRIVSPAPTNTLSQDDVLNALRDCYDPEVPCNIVDLGLVYHVEVVPEPDAPGAGIPGVPQKHRVAIQLTLTSPGCPAHDQIQAQIQGRLAAFPNISRTEVALVWEPRWTPHRISPEGRKRLGIE